MRSVFVLLTIVVCLWVPSSSQGKQVLYSPAPPSILLPGQLLCVEIYYEGGSKEVPLLPTKTYDVIQDMQNFCDLTKPYSVSVNAFEVHGCCLRK